MIISEMRKVPKFNDLLVGKIPLIFAAYAHVQSHIIPVNDEFAIVPYIEFGNHSYRDIYTCDFINDSRSEVMRLVASPQGLRKGQEACYKYQYVFKYLLPFPPGVRKFPT